ncbi:GNAT family N-acetyltransferase [Actinomadura kijaniata]|uniref:CelD/BcsL family acetyltransferase involved in cellulose biosynthesis n=1 Tax=Actinomadura namibiensis TaxID=182080 RepID=A0A7W3LLE4_ACTNM|nr:GNAT family N-acetyltransferase [Actinomadura namibiensis]MBA8950259.1 CelD/BcsL family acetyltransferase involved in cellulose biosynthesis [Actinomadura namibiensis]
MSTGLRHTPPVTWTTQVRSDDEALPQIEERWRDLYGRSATATPFQSFGWVTAWWRHYGRPGHLRLVLVWRDDELVAAAPLAASSNWRRPVWRPLSAGQSDFTDVLVDDRYADEAVDHLVRALLDRPGWHALDFPEVPPGAAVDLLARRWPRDVRRMPSSVCLHLPAGDTDAFLARFRGRPAGKLRTRLRRIDSHRLDVTRVPPDAAAEAVGDLLELHLGQWRGRGVNPEHTRARFRDMLAEASTAMIRDGQAAIVRYRRGEELVASDLLLIGRDFVGAYLYGSDPALRSGMDVSLMLLRYDLQLAHDLGVPRLSLLRGQEEYKWKWQPTPTRNHRVILCRSAVGGLYAAGAHGHARLRAFKQRRVVAANGGGAADA